MIDSTISISEIEKTETYKSANDVQKMSLKKLSVRKEITHSVNVFLHNGYINNSLQTIIVKSIKELANLIKSKNEKN